MRKKYYIFTIDRSNNNFTNFTIARFNEKMYLDFVDRMKSVSKSRHFDLRIYTKCFNKTKCVCALNKGY